jgi:hypothetical protein
MTEPIRIVNCLGHSSPAAAGIARPLPSRQHKLPLCRVAAHTPRGAKTCGRSSGHERPAEGIRAVMLHFLLFRVATPVRRSEY